MRAKEYCPGLLQPFIDLHCCHFPTGTGGGRGNGQNLFVSGECPYLTLSECYWTKRGGPTNPFCDNKRLSVPFCTIGSDKIFFVGHVSLFAVYNVLPDRIT